MDSGLRGMGIDADFGREELSRDVVRACRHWTSSSFRRDQCREPVLGLRGPGTNRELRGQDDRTRAPVTGLNSAHPETSGLNAAQPRGDGWEYCGQGDHLVVSEEGPSAPHVQETPPTEAVDEGDRSHVDDPESREVLPPEQAAFRAPTRDVPQGRTSTGR